MAAKNLTRGALVLLTCMACAKSPDAAPSTDQNPASPAMTGAPMDTLGQAEVFDAAGRSLGTVYFGQTTMGISVSGQIRGLPGAEHGMHIHTVGLCEGPEFTTAGGHWNPTAKQHGSDNPQGPHFGDLPNFMLLPDGSGWVQGVSRGGVMRGDANALTDADGASIVIHAGPDDYKTDPSGGSGARIACGVIKAR